MTTMIEAVKEQCIRIAESEQVLALVHAIEEASGAEAHLMLTVYEPSGKMDATIAYEYGLRDGTNARRESSLPERLASVERFERRLDRVIVLLRNALRSARQDGRRHG